MQVPMNRASPAAGTAELHRKGEKPVGLPGRQPVGDGDRDRPFLDLGISGSGNGCSASGARCRPPPGTRRRQVRGTATSNMTARTVSAVDRAAGLRDAAEGQRADRVGPLEGDQVVGESAGFDPCRQLALVGGAQEAEAGDPGPAGGHQRDDRDGNAVGDGEQQPGTGDRQACERVDHRGASRRRNRGPRAAATSAPTPTHPSRSPYPAEPSPRRNRATSGSSAHSAPGWEDERGRPRDQRPPGSGLLTT